MLTKDNYFKRGDWELKRNNRHTAKSSLYFVVKW